MAKHSVPAGTAPGVTTPPPARTLTTRWFSKSKSISFALVLRGALPAALVAAAVPCAVSGCAVSESDVRRWELTERGPDKLVAVLTHDKYSYELRTEAALSLIRMKPRGGRRIGNELLINALSSLPEEERKLIVNAMAPELVKNIQLPAPTRAPDAPPQPDPSVPFKDAAFAMLSHEPTLVSDPKTYADLQAAVTKWAQTDFEMRIESSSQQYGIEQMMRFLGAPAVRPLPAMFNTESTKIDRMAGLVADLGDPETKQKASEALVALAKQIESPEWVAKQTPLVQQANERAKVNATPEQVKQQIAKFQDQELTKIFAAMKRVGGRPAVEYALAYGGDKSKPEERRKAALASIEGRIEKGNQGDIEKVFEIARDDATPDALRDLAFARLGELPKEQIVPKLYTLFEGKSWKVRWVAGSLILRTITTKELGEFMRRLPSSPATKMGMSEPITYGAGIQKLDAPPGAPKPRDAVLAYLNARDLGPKLTALGYFYGGRKADLPLVQAHANDSTPVPKCDDNDECGWVCEVDKPGGAERESKKVSTVGEFAKFCIEPSMTGN
jgi:hypothetical protein